MPVLPPAPVGPFFQTLTGDAGANSLLGSNFADLIYGGDNGDSLNGRRGNDYLDGGNGNDIIQGGDGNDTLIGGEGNDTLNSNGGDDLMFGGEGNDRITADLDDSALTVAYGGTGQDQFQLVNASAGFLAQIGDFVFGEDSLTINGQSLQSLAGAGLSLTSGPSGVLVGFAGPGGSVLFDGLTAADFGAGLVLSGNDSLTGSDSADFFDGEAGNDVLDGGDGNDTLGGGDGNDVIDGGQGDDLIGGDRGNDTLNGGEGDDEIYGRFGNNLIDGGSGNDTLSTGRDSSTIEGGEGDDMISARLEAGGDHVLTGGNGADTFDFFGARSGRQSDNVITDFNVEEDSFTINGVDGQVFVDLLGLSYTDTEAGAVLVLPTGSTILFAGLTSYDLGFVPDIIS